MSAATTAWGQRWLYTLNIKHIWKDQPEGVDAEKRAMLEEIRQGNAA